MARGTYININFIWKQVKDIWLNKNGSWQNGVMSWWQDHGTWKKCMDDVAHTATTFTVNPGGFTVVSANADLPNGTVSFTSATCPYSISNLLVHAQVYHWLNGQVANVTYYSGSYTANTDLGYMSHVVYGPPIQGFGYTIYLRFEESI